MKFNELTRSPEKKQVVIYYANDVVETPKFIQIRKKALDSFDAAHERSKLDGAKKAMRDARASLEGDSLKLRSAVAQDVAEIQSILCTKGGALGADAIFFTAGSIVANKIMYCKDGVPAPLSEDLQKKFSSLYAATRHNEILESSPLADARMLNLAMQTAYTLFPASGYEYSVIIKSHGSANYAATSKIAVPVAKITPELVQKMFESRSLPAEGAVMEKSPESLDKSPESLDKSPETLEKTGESLEKSAETLEKSAESLEKSPETLDADEQPSSEFVGITKTQLLAALFGKRTDMYYNVVLLESCNSELGVLIQDLADWENPSLGYLFTSDKKGLLYKTISYGSAIRSKTNSFRQWFLDALSEVAAKKIK